MNRICKTCGSEWVIDLIEAEWARGQGTAMQRVCPSCRADKRGLQKATLTCDLCAQPFAWPKELALYASMFEWPTPTTCPAGCGGDLAVARELRGDKLAMAAVWLRVVRKIDLDAPPPLDLTPEQQLRATKVPKLEDLFRGLGSGMSTPSFGELPSGTPAGDARRPSEDVVAASRDDLPRESVPSPDSLFSGLGKKRV